MTRTDHSDDDENYVESDEENMVVDEEEMDVATVFSGLGSDVEQQLLQDIMVLNSYNDGENERSTTSSYTILQTILHSILMEIKTGDPPTLFCGERTIVYNEKSKRSFVGVYLAAQFLMHIFPNTVKMRDLFYFHRRFFRNQKESDQAIENLCALLDVSRLDLGFSAEAKGLVWGNLQVFDASSQEELLDCTVVPQLISDEIWMKDDLRFSLTAETEYILVVEKACIFHQLVTGINQLKNCIVLTGKGFPDRATCEAVRRIHLTSGLPVFVLADCDPHGVHICNTYQRAGIPVWWLGLRPSQVETTMPQPWISQSSLLELSDREKGMLIDNGPLMDPEFDFHQKAISTNNDRMTEIRNMQHMQRKVELEALYDLDVANLKKFVEVIINDYMKSNGRDQLWAKAI